MISDFRLVIGDFCVAINPTLPAFRNNALQKSRQPIFGSPRQVFDRTRRQRPRYSPFDFVQGTLILRLQDRQQMHRAIVMLYLTHVLPDSPANSRRRMMSHLNSESFDLIARSFETGLPELAQCPAAPLKLARIPPLAGRYPSRLYLLRR